MKSCQLIGAASKPDLRREYSLIAMKPLLLEPASSCYGTTAVVKDQVSSELSGLPATSLAPPLAPFTVAT